MNYAQSHCQVFLKIYRLHYISQYQFLFSFPDLQILQIFVACCLMNLCYILTNLDYHFNNEFCPLRPFQNIPSNIITFIQDHQECQKIHSPRSLAVYQKMTNFKLRKSLIFSLTIFLELLFAIFFAFYLTLSNLTQLIILLIVYNIIIFGINIKIQTMQKQTIKPYFHYNCKNDVSIIDSQYTYEGNFLAVCTSNASILIYKSPIEQNPLQEQDYNPVVEYNQVNKNNCFLKLAWSFYNASILAAISISNEISYFEFDKSTLRLQKSIKCENIPIFGAFLPSFHECIFSVGLSDGSISLYNQNLEEISTHKEHKQSVNWLSWERRLGISERNRWISEYFPSHVNQQYLTNIPPMLASCSSDSLINFWFIKNKKLELIHSFKAHQKEIRQVMWRPNYFNNSKYRNFVSCSQDGFVKFWQISQAKGGKYQQKMKSQRNFNGPVYRAQYNSLGTMIAISYYGGEQGKVQTKVFSDKQSILGQQIQILQ